MDNDSKKIYISLPAPKVSITTSSGIRQMSGRKQHPQPHRLWQYQALISEIEDDGLALVEADGIYADAEENMITIIRNCLSGFEDFEIIFL